MIWSIKNTIQYNTIKTDFTKIYAGEHVGSVMITRELLPHFPTIFSSEIFYPKSPSVQFLIVYPMFSSSKKVNHLI